MSDQSFRGVPVNCCFPGSPSAKAGIRAGDVILIANGRRVDSLDAYLDARNVYADRVELTVQRGPQVLEFVLRFPQVEPRPVLSQPDAGDQPN